MGVTAGVAMAAVAIAGGVMSGVSQKAAMESQERLAKATGERQKQQLTRRAENRRRQESKVAARARARRAGSGVAFSGTPLLVEEERAGNIELAVQTLLNEAEAANVFQRNRARAFKDQGNRALVQGVTGGIFKAGSTLMDAGVFDGGAGAGGSSALFESETDPLTSTGGLGGGMS